MHKLLVLYPRPEDPRAFTDYYTSTHLPLAAQLPGMLDWRYSLDVDGGDWFAVFEADFADADEFAAAMASPEGRAVEADVPRYAPPGTTVVHYEIAAR